MESKVSVFKRSPRVGYKVWAEERIDSLNCSLVLELVEISLTQELIVSSVGSTPNCFANSRKDDAVTADTGAGAAGAAPSAVGVGAGCKRIASAAVSESHCSAVQPLRVHFSAIDLIDVSSREIPLAARTLRIVGRKLSTLFCSSTGSVAF